MKVNVLNDKIFNEEYNRIIKPFCDKYEMDEYFISFDGEKMHYLKYINDNADKNIILIHGFTECAKKLDEMAYYFFSEGYNVFSLDLRGHGLSYKDSAPQYGVDIDDFDIYAKDLIAFIYKVVNSENNYDIDCFTHSLGGTVALSALIDNNDLPINKLVLSSPMICGNMGMPVSVAKAVASIMVAFGKGKAPAPNKCVFKPNEDNADATSIERGRHAIKLKVDNAEYQTCGPTFNWVLASINACDKILKKSNLITNNILVIKPQFDAQLLESYQDKFISSCKNIEVINTANTCHEIYQSKSSELEDYINSILAFLK